MKKVGIVLNKNQNKNYPAGDFRSPECIELLKEADIVVTNPPFSLIREFISQLVGYNKKFLIISNSNAIGCKKIFPLFKENKIWLGAATQTKSPRKKARIHSVWFRVPDSYELKNSPCCKIDESGKKYILMISACWFTNLKANYKVKPLDLSKKHYTPEKYPKYDNYDAINVDKVADIPCDYPGVMGVPLSFVDKYCPEQFYIEGISNSPETLKDIGIIGEKWITLYRQQGGKGHYSANMKIPVSTINGRAVSHYHRIFIKNKKLYQR